MTRDHDETARFPVTQMAQLCAAKRRNVPMPPSVQKQEPARLNRKFHHFVPGLSTGLLSLPGFQEHLWLCSGVPTMIPVGTICVCILIHACLIFSVLLSSMGRFLRLELTKVTHVLLDGNLGYARRATVQKAPRRDRVLYVCFPYILTGAGLINETKEYTDAARSLQVRVLHAFHCAFLLMFFCYIFQGYPTPTQVDNRRIYGPLQSSSLAGQIY